MSPFYNVLLQTSIVWFANYTSPNNTWANGRTTNATHTILPRSLGVPPRMNNTETTNWLSTYLPGLHNYTATRINDMPTIIDEQNRRIVMHVHGVGNSDIGSYKDEYLFVLKTTEDGHLIEESFEYIDSYLILRYWEGGRSVLGWRP